MLDALLGADPDEGLAREELVERTGLARATIANLVSILRDHGLLAVSENGDRGKRAEVVRLRTSVGFAFVVELNHKLIRCAIADMWGRVLDSDESSDIEVDQHASESLTQAASSLRDLLRSHGTPTDVIGVGIALAAPIDPSTGKIREGMLGDWGGSMRDWLGVDARKELRQRLAGGDRGAARPWGSFFIGNDANAAGLAEYRRYAQMHGEPRGAVLYVKWSDGIGGSLLLNGTVQEGFGGLAMEIGHLPVPGVDPREGERCDRCGAKNCLELIGSVKAMCDRLGERHDGFPSGESAHAEIVEVADYIGRVLAPIVAAVNPEVVIIGGPSQEQYTSVVPPIQLALRKYGLAPASGDADVLLGAYGANAVVDGTVHALLSRLSLPYLLRKKQ